MSNSSYAARLLEITPATSDADVALLIAKAATEREQIRFRFSINHDVRGPKYEACPLAYDWQRKAKVGIDTALKSTALHWLVNAATQGFDISEVNVDLRDIGPIYGIAKARQRAEYHRRPKPEYGDDDDIPF